MELIKLAIFMLTILLAPVVLLFIFWKKTRLTMKVGIIVLVGVILMVMYPIMIFAIEIEKIKHFFSNDCRSAISLSKGFLDRPYNKFQNDIIGKLYGFTPKAHFLETIAICEYKLGDKSETFETLKELIPYMESSPYDKGRIEKLKMFMEKTRNEIHN